LTWIDENIAQGAEIEAINIKGPGDPLIEIEPTLETLHLMQEKHPQIKVILTTSGVHGEKHAIELAKSGVAHVTLLVDAVDPEIAEKLYAWIRPEKKTVPLAEAVDILISEQRKAVTAFKDAGCRVSIKTRVYPGYNDAHIEKIAKTMSTLGVEDMALVPYRPGTDPEKEMPTSPSDDMMARIDKQVGKYLLGHIIKEPTVSGLGQECKVVGKNCITDSTLTPKPTKNRPNVAVASLTGMDVDLHLGQAYTFLIYGPREDGLPCLLENRPAPEAGGGDSRWQELAESLGDCFALLASGAGNRPTKVLTNAGITVLITENEIEGTVDVLFGGGKTKKKC